MKESARPTGLVAAWCAIWVMAIIAVPAARSEECSAAAGVPGGFCIHLGCGDGARTVAIAATGRFVVHGWDKDPALVETARKALLVSGLYGAASVDGGPLDPLPYADNLASIVVADNLPRLLANGLSAAEVVRVTAPGGAALFGAGPSEAELKTMLAGAGLKDLSFKKAGNWTVVRKPRTPGMDEWTNVEHDAGCGKVSDDALVTPTEVRWVAGPTLNSFRAPVGTVSAGGRNFYLIFREQIPLAHNEGDGPEKGAQLFLVARDGWNGVPLWRVPVKGTRLAADAGHVYVLEGGAIHVFDSVTGAPAGTLQGCGEAEHILLSGKFLAVAGKAAVCLIDASSGREAWKAPVSNLTAAVMGDNRVFVCEKDKDILAFELLTGRLAWKTETASWNDGTVREFFLRRETLVAIAANGASANVRALSPADGNVRWQHKYQEAKGEKPECFLADSQVWVYDKSSSAWLGLDSASGEEKHKFSSFGIYGNCAPDAATDQYFICTRPCNFVSWKDGKLSPFRVTRLSCAGESFDTPVANGLFYSLQSGGCGCVLGAVHGCCAFAPSSGAGPKPDAPETPARLEVFPPANPPPAPSATPPAAAADDWPMFRHDACRSAGTSSVAPSDLNPLWEATPCDQKKEAGLLFPDWHGRPEGDDLLSAPVVCGGRVYLSLPDLHRVAAFDAATGKPVWNRTLCGRVDFPPAVCEGVCLAGCRDGRVYALSAANGAVLWRFRAAPAEKRIVSFGQTESVWPVLGGILLQDGVACALAGRSMDIDGGMWLYGLDPKSGKLLWSARPEGGAADTLVSDGKGITLRGMKNALDPQTGKQIEAQAGSVLAESGRSLEGLIDRSWRWWSDPGDRCHLRMYNGMVGQVVAFGGGRIYAYREGRGRGLRSRTITGRDEKGSQVLWKLDVPPDLEVTALAVAGDMLLAAMGGGLAPDAKGALWIIDGKTGAKANAVALPAAAGADGIAVAGGRIYLTMRDGHLRCYGRR